MKQIHFFLIVMVVLGLTITKCSSSSSHSGETDWETYSNEFFSIDFPSDWEFKEEINEIPDSIPFIEGAISKGIRVSLYNNDPKSKGEGVIVQKSSFGEDMISRFDDPEFWLMTSIMSKENDDSYLGIVEDMVSDSLSFEGYPAARVGFVVEVEEGDTIIMKQTIVIVDGKELYYLNNQFIGGDDSEESLGDSILETIRFKNGMDEL